MYDFKTAVETISTKLGENSTLVQEELTQIISESNTLTSRLKEVNSESANRRVELKTLKDEHAKQIDSYSDYDSLKDQLGQLNTKLEDSQNELNEVYSEKRNKLKSLYSQFDFEDERLKPISARFKGAESIDDLSPKEVKEEMLKFELLSVNKTEKSGAVPNPSKKQENEKPVNKYSYKE